MSEEYLSINQLSDRLDLDVKTIQNKMSQGILKRGVHWFRPRGLRPRFKWSAIVTWLEEKEGPALGANVGTGADPGIVIPMSRRYNLGGHR